MAEKLRFGYLVPTRDAVMRAPDGRADLQRMIELAVRAERVGFDSVWIGDSIIARPRFEALTTLAAIATVTKRVELGTAVYISPLRHPVPLAHTVGNLDLLSGGRLLFGIGIGPQSPPVMTEYAACGADFHKRGMLLEENLRIMKGLWTGQPFSFDGNFYKLDKVRLHPLPARAGGPPVLMAAAADKALKRLARYADGWLPISPNPESLREDWEKIVAGCGETQRVPGTLMKVLYTTLTVSQNDVAAEREMDDFLLAYYGAQQKPIIARYQGHCAGSPERCADFLRGFVDAGVRHFCIRFGAAEQEPQMDRFLTDVVPLLA